MNSYLGGIGYGVGTGGAGNTPVAQNSNTGSFQAGVGVGGNAASGGAAGLIVLALTLAVVYVATRSIQGTR